MAAASMKRTLHGGGPAGTAFLPRPAGDLPAHSPHLNRVLSSSTSSTLASSTTVGNSNSIAVAQQPPQRQAKRARTTSAAAAGPVSADESAAPEASAVTATVTGQTRSTTPPAPLVLSFSESEHAVLGTVGGMGQGTVHRTVPEWRARAERVASGDATPSSASAAPRVSKHRYAMVCSSNVNRSVLGQIVLSKKGTAVSSYGVGTDVRLPGRSRMEPAVFPFGTPYLEMHDRLLAEDEQLYTRNGVLRLLSRNAMTKRHPERWQDLSTSETVAFDVVICFENRIFDICVEDLQNRQPDEFKPVQVVALPVKDTPQDAEQAMADVEALYEMLEECDDLESSMIDIMDAFQQTTSRPVLHQVCHL